MGVERQALAPQDWNSGTSKWLIDFVAPFGQIEQIIPMLTRNPDETRLRTLWHNKAGTRHRVVEWNRPDPAAQITVKSYGAGQFARVLAAG